MITTGLQLAILGGVLAGAGLAGLVWRLAPVHAHPGDGADLWSAPQPLGSLGFWPGGRRASVMDN